jgi:hypothetical protein
MTPACALVAAWLVACAVALVVLWRAARNAGELCWHE